jgi:hypothetical protein
MTDLRTAAQQALERLMLHHRTWDARDDLNAVTALKAALEVDDAAAELRRLHAENERLHQINQSHEMKLSVRGYETQIDDLRLAHAELHALNGELLEALKRISATKNLARELEAEWCPAATGMVRMARAAIARAEGKV